MQRILILGAGGFGREVLAWARTAWDGCVFGFLDDNLEAPADSRLRAPVVGRIDGYIPESRDVFVCAIGDPIARRSITERIKGRGGRFVSVIHPSAVVADGARIGEGVIVCPFAVVSVDSWVNDGAVIYYHSSVDHDTLVGPFAQISGHCDIMGGVCIGAGAFVGSHAAVLPRIKVGERAVVGAGAVVTRDVPAMSTVCGIPARIVV